MLQVLLPVELPPLQYWFRASFFTFVPSLGIAFFVLTLPTLIAGSPSGPIVTEANLAYFFGGVIFAPITETILMVGVNYFISIWFKSESVLIALGALVFSLIHSLVASAWGLVTFWPFVILFYTYRLWGLKQQYIGIWMTIAVHSTHNALAFLALSML